jgi:hypothetical protein
MKAFPEQQFAGDGFVEFEIAYAPTEQFEQILPAGWNFMGNPLMSTESVAEILVAGSRPAINSQLWGWQAGKYRLSDPDGALEPETGFWLFCESETPIRLLGIPADGEILLLPGWNLISPVGDCILPEIPGVSAQAGGYELSAEGYRMIQPGKQLFAGKAYWFFVAAQQPVEIFLGTAPE